MAVSQVQLDAYSVNGGGTQSFTVAHPGGSDVLLLVVAAWSANWSDNVTSPTYDGVGGTQVAASFDGNTKYSVHRWENPPTGLKPIAWTGVSNANTPLAIHAVWFTGVDQTTPINGPDTVAESSGATRLVSETMTAAADEIIFMAISGFQNGVSWSGPGTNTTSLQLTDLVASGTIHLNSLITNVLGYDTISLASSFTVGQMVNGAMVINATTAGNPVNASHSFRRRRRMAA